MLAVMKDDLDRLIDELAEGDPSITARVAAALERRELARQLAERRRSAGLTQSEVAERMGTSQGQVTRFESGADTRLSTVARYAAAVGMKVEWAVAPLRQPSSQTSERRGARVRDTAGSRRSMSKPLARRRRSATSAS
jgi:transcriptional regulator with XRE-family HTH domain